MHAETHVGLEVQVLLLLIDFDQNWKWSPTFLRTVQAVWTEADGTSKTKSRTYQLHGVTFQTTAILICQHSALLLSSDERVSQSVTNLGINVRLHSGHSTSGTSSDISL